MKNGLLKSPRFTSNLKIWGVSQSSIVSGMLALFLVSTVAGKETKLETTGLTEPLANIQRAADKLVVNAIS
jgi:hypothetical protein